MITFNSNSVCKQAQSYYYDYLCDDLREHIPTEMLAHMNRCQHCQGEINTLKNVLAESEKIEQANPATIACLKLHFNYIGTSVTCKTVRPFLPSLADHALEIGVPTPITVHLDKCQQCTNDLEIIQQLNLNHKQLCRLGQLFAEKPAEDAIKCSQAQAIIPSIVSMVFQEASAEVLKHLCTCPNCRKHTYQHREMLRIELLHSIAFHDQLLCEAVSVNDIFDYCIPYGIKPATDQYAKFRPAFTSHARRCPKCLAKVQKLHNTVYGILERPESGIVTCFKAADEFARDSTVSGPDDMYEGWPIEVQVSDKSKPTPVTSAEPAGYPRSFKQRIKEVNLKQFIKPVAAAAAILTIAALLVFNNPVARAVNLGQIYKALEPIKNVCITTFVPQESKPTQEIWVSQALNIKMFKTETQCVLWDIKNKSQKSRDLNTSSVTIAELNNDALTKVEETMEAPWGLLPFDNISAIPEGAIWQKVTTKNLKTTIPNTGVYDLAWTQKKLSGIVYNKWRFYIDTETRLPRKVEQWMRFAGKEYELLSVMEVVYPTTVEVQAAIASMGF